MASIFRRKEKSHPSDLTIEYKATGTNPGDGATVYAEVVALEPLSIGGGGAASAVTIVDGGDVAQGTTSDVAWVSGAGTVISLLKKIASAGGSAVSIADGADTAQGSTADTSAASTVVGILKAIKAAVQGTLTTSVSNFPATQPVSLATNTPDVIDRAARLLGHVTVDNASIAVTLATNTPDVTDRAARLLGHVTVDNASLAVTGTFFPATQAVSLAINTPDVTDRAARLLGHVTVDNASIAITAAALPLPAGAATSANQSTVKAASTVAAATDTASVVQHSPQRADAANLCQTTTAATGVAATLTLPAPAAGLFHYISLIEIQLYATAARTGGVTPVLVTTTNLPGSPVWDFDTGQAIGVTIRQTTQPATPIKSSVAATATTIVAPIATTGIWRITAYYYTAP